MPDNTAVTQPEGICDHRFHLIPHFFHIETCNVDTCNSIAFHSWFVIPAITIIEQNASCQNRRIQKNCRTSKVQQFFDSHINQSELQNPFTFNRANQRITPCSSECITQSLRIHQSVSQNHSTFTSSGIISPRDVAISSCFGAISSSAFMLREIL